MKGVATWISNILAAILGVLVGIFVAPILFIFLTFFLLLMWSCCAFICLVLPFYMGIEAMDEVKV
jgi:hypothetical protein